MASHSAADTDVTNWNTQVAAGVAALFDSMVQVVDLDAVVGSDANLPATMLSYFSTDGGHLNSLGNQMAAYACWKALAQLQAPTTDSQNIANMQVPSSPVYSTGAYRRIIRSGQSYLPDEASVAPAALLYTAVAGDMFAFPFLVTECCEYWTTVFMDQSNAGVSTLRVGWYDDVVGLNGPSGYPQCLKRDMGDVGNYTMSGAAVNTVSAGVNRPIHVGLNWLCVCIQTAGATASTFYTMYGGGSLIIPSWNGLHIGTAANILQPVGYKVTGVAAGGLPTVFPSGGVLAGAAAASTGIVAPLIAVTRTIQ